MLGQSVVTGAEGNEEGDKGKAGFTCSSSPLSVLSGDAMPCCWWFVSLCIEHILLLDKTQMP